MRVEGWKVGVSERGREERAASKGSSTWEPESKRKAKNQENK